MEEHVALDSKKQKKFVKSLKGIKKLMKETGALPETPQKEKKPIKSGKIKKKRRPARGLVYLSHIPHGFYEHQMTEYFKQFGMVTNARVIRSKHTGRSKGYAFVEFNDLTVAQVVAETMNNYLMGKRLIKAVYIPPKDQRVKAQRKNWNPQDNPARTVKLNMKKAYNSEKSEKEDLKIATKLLSNLTNTKNKLRELGINYDFFTPVDVPEEIADKLKVKNEKEEDSKNNILENPKITKKKKNKDSQDETKDGDTKPNDIISSSKQDNLKTKQNESTIKQKEQKKLNRESVVSEMGIIALANDESKSNHKINKQSNGTDKAKETAKNNKKQIIESLQTTAKLDTNKKQKLQEAGVKPLEDFISIDQDDDDSDSTYQFDSDDYENEINAEDSDFNESNATDEEDVNEESGKDFDNSESNEMPLQKNKKNIKNVVVHTEQIQPKVKQEPILNSKKRKVPEKMAEPTKKPKFEKKNNKKLSSKQLKKKK